MHNIIETLQDKLIFNRFLEMIMRTNFAEILEGKGPFTLLAPVDDVFDLLPDGGFDKIMKDRDVLTNIISQHVIIGKLNTEDIKKMDELPTMANQTLAVEEHGGGIIIGGCRIIEPDINCKNGFIQVIDLVLMP